MGMTKKETKANAEYKEDYQLSGRLADTRDKYAMEKRFIYLDEQWEPQARARRKREERPIVTVNTSRQFIQQVANGVRKNPPSIQVVPLGDGAELAEAMIREDIIRGIQRDSDADEAYIHAIEDAAAGGYGIVKIEPEYESNESFTQVLRIKRVLDASTCYIDPRAREPDFSDMRFFIEEIPYSANQLGSLVGSDDAAEIKEFLKGSVGEDRKMWGDKKTAKLISHWRVEMKPDTLYQMKETDESGNPVMRLESEGVKMDDVMVGEDGKPMSRPSYSKKVVWRRLMAKKVLSEMAWPGDSIPVGISVGQHVVVEDTTEFVSLTRPLIDTQRIRNFARSNQVELMATSPKARFKATLESIPEELRHMWETAHKENWRVLYWQHRNEDKSENLEPSEIQPIGPSAALTQEIAITDQEAHQVTGRYQDSQAERSQATSGKAIGLQKETGDTATIHFEHNGSVMLRYLGNCILDVMSSYYDTNRKVSAVAKDGTARMVRINAPDTDERGKDYSHTITDTRYGCAVTVGPSYATKLMQSMDTLQTMLQANPAMAQARPDLIAKTFGDAVGWTNTQEWVESLQALIPPPVQQHLDQLKQGEGGGPQIPPQVSAQMQAMGQQIQQMQALLAQAQPEMERLKHDNELDWFKAQTDRAKVLISAGIEGITAVHDAEAEAEKAHIQAAAGHSANLLKAHMAQQQAQANPQQPEAPQQAQPQVQEAA